MHWSISAITTRSMCHLLEMPTYIPLNKLPFVSHSHIEKQNAMLIHRIKAKKRGVDHVNKSSMLKYEINCLYKLFANALEI